MKAVTSNRISGLIDDDVAAPVETPTLVRSPAQREASRKNGALSAGPITMEGKSRSSMNALKHGLLARRIVPPCDSRGDDGMFRKARRSLVEELQPQTFTQHALIESLAGDYVILARARSMVEAMFRPPIPVGVESDHWKARQGAKRQLNVLGKLIAQSECGERFACYPRDARRVADDVITAAKQLESEVADIAAEEASGDASSDEFEIQEDEQRQRLSELIKPALHRLRDVGYLVDVLSGERLPAKGDAKRLHELLRTLQEGAKIHLGSMPKVEEAMERREANKEIALASSPQPLILLERYVARIERSIEKKLKQFFRR